MASSLRHLPSVYSESGVASLFLEASMWLVLAFLKHKMFISLELCEMCVDKIFKSHIVLLYSISRNLRNYFGGM